MEETKRDLNVVHHPQVDKTRDNKKSNRETNKKERRERIYGANEANQAHHPPPNLVDHCFRKVENKKEEPHRAH